MKESVIDILIYLFENYADPEFQNEIESDAEQGSSRDALRDELIQAGFRVSAIDSALSWLDTLATTSEKNIVAPTTRAIRVFSDSECSKLDAECRGYVLYLEHIGILTASQRELVVDRLIDLAPHAGDAAIDLEQVKWAVLMVLFSQPGQEAAYARMEDLLFSSRAEVLH